MTRTDAVIKTIVARLEAMRPELDRATGLRELRLDVHFSPDCLEPREVVVHRTEGERRKRTG